MSARAQHREMDEDIEDSIAILLQKINRIL